MIIHLANQLVDRQDIYKITSVKLNETPFKFKSKGAGSPYLPPINNMVVTIFNVTIDSIFYQY